MNRVSVEIDIDLPAGVTLREYQRHEDAHAFHIAWALPERIRCQRCGREQPAQFTFKNKFAVVRDLDLWGQPSFFTYQPPQHQCLHCARRQQPAFPFKRQDVKYTYRFEEYVMRSLIGSTAEEVAERLGISAETVALIVKNRLADAQAQTVDAGRTITDVGLDEISLKKRHKLYATVLTDLTHPDRPEVLAVAEGKDEAAARACLEQLSPAQREAVRTHRTDMGAAFVAACRAALPNSQSVLDRFHVAKAVGDWADGRRKKNHPRLQEEAEREGAESVPVADVGVPPPPAGPDCRGTDEAGSPLRDAAGVGSGLPHPRGTGGDF